MALIPSLQAGSQFGPAQFSHDSRFLFTCCGSVVKVFNTSNGECVNELQGHTKQVTGVMLNKGNVLQKDCVAAGIRNKLSIYSMKTGKTKIMHDTDKFNRTKAVTCVACHPTESCVAAGLENGRILLWYNFLTNSAPAMSTLHWHSLAVTCLSFTPDGSCMLSGGHECVLVRWQMGSQNNRDFKPRMGAPLCKVQSSPDGTLYAVNTGDNVIQLLDIGLRVLIVYRGLTRCSFDAQSPIPCGLVYDPRSRTLVTNGLPGHLQFYSLALNKQLYNLDIVGQNYISPENIDRPTVVTEVTSVAVSHDGQWVATFEVWDDRIFSPEMRLKFWMYNSEAQTYTLNTRVEDPHEERITKMLFRPPSPNKTSSEQTPCLVTVGQDSCFKLWILLDDTDIYRKNVRWDCDFVGFYRGLQGFGADFSSDGSSLAVAFEHLLTVWDPDNCVVRTTLSNGLLPKEDIRHVKFGSHDCRHQLVLATTQHLISWDLLSLSIIWSMEEQTSILIKDPVSDLMAAVSSNNFFVFRPSSHTKLYKHENVSSSEILDAVFAPDARSSDLLDLGWPGNSQVYFYNAEQQLITLDSSSHQQDSSKKTKIAQNLPQSARKSFLAESVSRETQQTSTKDTMRRTAGQETVLTNLLQSNEPVSLYCGKYLNHLLVKKKHQKRTASHAINDDSESEPDEAAEEDSSSESEEETSGPPSKRARSVDDNNADDMDKLLSKPLDWVQWCSSLSLK
ncbi:WD repeat-containing protein 75-like [Elysia marginata]|uniref:WD repeat-containing protein 75-like n=1 Tax=Elysia marginata TaxID=1093978 RepID=A0AAV4GA83_9GAST|nr:WD repeat-containing protein 75-like [Elysia marginata]